MEIDISLPHVLPPSLEIRNINFGLAPAILAVAIKGFVPVEFAGRLSVIEVLAIREMIVEPGAIPTPVTLCVVASPVVSATSKVALPGVVVPENILLNPGIPSPL